jgi:hypothetical protein
MTKAATCPLMTAWENEKYQQPDASLSVYIEINLFSDKIRRNSKFNQEFETTCVL